MADNNNQIKAADASVAERTLDNRTAGRLRSASIVTQSLQGHVPLRPKSMS